MWHTQLLHATRRAFVGWVGSVDTARERVFTWGAIDNEYNEQLPDDQNQSRGVNAIAIQQAGTNILSASLALLSLPPTAHTQKTYNFRRMCCSMSSIISTTVPREHILERTNSSACFWPWVPVTCRVSHFKSAEKARTWHICCMV